MMDRTYFLYYPWSPELPYANPNGIIAKFKICFCVRRDDMVDMTAWRWVTESRVWHPVIAASELPFETRSVMDGVGVVYRYAATLSKPTGKMVWDGLRRVGWICQ